MLELGEFIKDGDQFLCDGKWMDDGGYFNNLKFSSTMSKYRRPIKTARKQPTTRASRNAGGVKQSRPALRKARDVVGNDVLS